MSIDHLSDEQIQDYLDGNRDYGSIEEHLAICQQCAADVAQYSQFFTGLKSADPDYLSDGFIDKVMAKVPKKLYRQKAVRPEWLQIAAALAMLLGGILYFVDFSVVSASMIPSWSSGLFGSVSGTISQGLDSTSLGSLGAEYIVSALLILTMVPIADAVLRKGRVTGHKACL